MCVCEIERERGSERWNERAYCRDVFLDVRNNTTNKIFNQFDANERLLILNSNVFDSMLFFAIWEYTSRLCSFASTFKASMRNSDL